MATRPPGQQAQPQALPRRRRRRQLDDYEPRTTMMLRRHARRTGNRELADALDDPDFRRAANAAVINAAEDEGVDVDDDRPFLTWLLDILNALKPVIIKVITQLLESWAGGLGGPAGAPPAVATAVNPVPATRGAAGKRR